jgi:hypothetical protein
LKENRACSHEGQKEEGIEPDQKKPTCQNKPKSFLGQLGLKSYEGPGRGRKARRSQLRSLVQMLVRCVLQ